MSHYPPINSHRNSVCKCKNCLNHDHIQQQRINNQRSHNDQRQPNVPYGHLSGGGAPPGNVSCGHARGKSPPRYQKLEQPPCCRSKGKNCNVIEDSLECHKNHFRELRKTWSEFARVCNCPNCKGSLQKERYLDKLAESADRNSAYKDDRMHCGEECCNSASSIPSSNLYNHKPPRPVSRPSDYDYDEEQMHMRQQHDEYHMQHKKHQHQQNLQRMSPLVYHEVSSDELLMDCPGNVDCKCLTCSCRGSPTLVSGCGVNTSPTVRGGMRPKHTRAKTERLKHHYY